MKEILADFGLPEILKENLEESEYNHRIKYRNLYIRLIKKCQGMTEQELSGYNEKHHILPKCMGGSNEKENLVLMPVRYHVMAHIVLIEAYPKNYKLYYAVHIMFYNTKPEIKDNIIKHFSSRTIARERETSVLHRTGENHPVYGNHRTEEEKQITKEKYIWSNNPRSNKVVSPDGKIYGSLSEASRETKIPYMTLTKWLSGEISNHGWTYLNGIKTNFSNRSTEKSSKKVIGPDKIIYSSIKEASDKNNISYTTLRYWLTGRVKDNHGWSFYNENNSN